jgi:O-antigen ligase
MLFLLGAAPVFPPGLSDGTRDPSGAVIHGLYPGGDEGGCCWLADTAALRVLPPAEADSLIVTIFVPDYAPFRARPEGLDVRIESGPSEHFCCFGPGIHQFAVRLSPHRTAHPILLFIAARVSFVPAQIGINQDPRRLSVLFRRIDYRDATGLPIVTSIGGTAATAASPIVALSFVALFVLAVWATRRRPVWGLALLIVAAPLGGDVSFGASSLSLYKAILPGVILGSIGRGAWRELLRDRRARFVFAAVLAVVFACALSAFHATFRVPVIRETLKWLEYAVTFAVAYVAFRSDSDARVARFSIIAIAVLVCSLALAQEFGGSPEGVFVAGHAIPRIAGPLEGPNQLAAWLEIATAVVLTSVVQLSNGAVVVVAALTILTSLLTFSRGGAIGLLASISVVATRLYVRQRTAVVVVLTATALAIAAVGWRLLFHAPGSGAADSFNGGLGTRAQLWSAALEMFRSSPLIGVGAGNYEMLLDRYGLIGVHTHANSWYLQGLAEGGIVMLCAILLLVGASLAAFLKSREPFAVAALAATVALSVHQIADDVVFYPKVALIWFLLMGIATAAISKPSLTEESSQSGAAVSAGADR